ncbi:MAG: FeoA family protein [Methanobacteriaceae archaeon]
MQKLTDVQPGKKVIIKQIKGGFGIRNRFESLNIREGKEVQIVASGPFRGPLVLNIDGCKVAVGRGMAAKISVEEIDENSFDG